MPETISPKSVHGAEHAASGEAVPNSKTWFGRLALMIGLLTILVGGVQLLFPALALSNLGLPSDGSALFSFRLASLMILLFGGLLVHEVIHPDRSDRFGKGVFWVALQKITAGLLLAVGIFSHGLNTLAWGVVAYDTLCGIFLLWLALRPASSHASRLAVDPVDAAGGVGLQ